MTVQYPFEVEAGGLLLNAKLFKKTCAHRRNMETENVRWCRYSPYSIEENRFAILQSMMKNSNMSTNVSHIWMKYFFEFLVLQPN